MENQEEGARTNDASETASNAQCETPMSDHVDRFWKYLETETVRIRVDMKRTVGAEDPDGPVIYWDGASFSDDVAKALVAEHKQSTADAKQMLAALKLNDALIREGQKTDAELREAMYATKAAIAKAMGL